MDALALSDSGDIFSSAASAHQDQMDLGFSVFVEEDPIDMPMELDEGSISELLDGLPSSNYATSHTDTATLSSEDDERPKQSQKQQQQKKKRERVDEPALQVPPPGTNALLEKPVELSVMSLEAYDSYLDQVKRTHRLSDAEHGALLAQRRRIRNRLYSMQKRQKEKKVVRSLEDLQKENEELRADNLRLRAENGRLKEALSRSGGMAFPGGRTTLFALVVTCALFVSPVSPLAFAGGGGSRGNFGTGRTLMSTAAPRGSGSGSWRAMLSTTMRPSAWLAA